MVDVFATAVVVVAVSLVLAGLGWFARRLHAEPSRRTIADGGLLSGFGKRELTVHEKPGGLLRWVTTVDHKDIGILYILFGVAAGLWGGTDAMMIRAELVTPEATVWSAGTYHALFTTHGLTMLFLFVTPAAFGVANYFIPLLIGADDMAFPRINAIAFWMLPPALLLIRGGIITDMIGITTLAPPETGWTFYTPLATLQSNPQVSLTLLGLHLSGISTTLGAINFIVTLFTERGEDVSWADLDIFSWTMLTTSGIILFAFPLLGAALVMLLMDRIIGTTFFASPGGGPLLWQHLFWFFGHPEVYILVLPAMGAISLILPKFAGRKLFGFKYIVYSTLAIGVLSFGVWAHHMFTTGIDPRIRASFMAVSIAIAVPSAVKTFNWITTMWNGRIRLTTPMLFCVGAVSTFIVGGITGVFLAAIPIDLVYQDTYYVVGHFHLIIVGLIMFGLFAANYYWYPILTGRMYDRRLGKLHFWITFAGVWGVFGLLVFIGMLGLPRRFATYPVEFAIYQQVASGIAFVLAGAQVIWFWNMVQSLRVGPRVETADVWDLKETGQFTREWEWFERRLEERRD